MIHDDKKRLLNKLIQNRLYNFEVQIFAQLASPSLSRAPHTQTLNTAPPIADTSISRGALLDFLPLPDPI